VLGRLGIALHEHIGFIKLYNLFGKYDPELNV